MHQLVQNKLVATIRVICCLKPPRLARGPAQVYADSSKITFLDLADFAHIRRWSYLQLPLAPAGQPVEKSVKLYAWEPVEVSWFKLWICGRKCQSSTLAKVMPREKLTVRRAKLRTGFQIWRHGGSKTESSPRKPRKCIIRNTFLTWRILWDQLGVHYGELIHVQDPPVGCFGMGSSRFAWSSASRRVRTE